MYYTDASNIFASNIFANEILKIQISQIMRCLKTTKITPLKTFVVFTSVHKYINIFELHVCIYAVMW